LIDHKSKISPLLFVAIDVVKVCANGVILEHLEKKMNAHFASLLHGKQGITQMLKKQ